MPINDDDLMSAISAGAAEAGTPLSNDNDSTDESPLESVVDSGATPDADAPEASVDGSDGTVDAAADGEKPAGEGEVDPKTGEAAKAAAKPGEDKNKPLGEDGKPKVIDPLNDPIPNALKRETKERIQTLISTVKTTTTQRDEAVAERDELVSHIMDTGASPQEYGDALNTLKMMKSGDPAQLEQVYNFLSSKAAEVARVLGKPIPGADMLQGHDDLREAVSAGSMLQEHAEELAAARDARKLQTQTFQQQRETSQQTQREQAARQQGKDSLNALALELKKDPQFAAKHAVIKELVKDVIAQSPPEKWADIYRRAYVAYKLPAPSKTIVPGTTNQPMRAKTPAGGAQRAPGSILDAVKQSLNLLPAE